jgi:hypothetical protein
MRIFQNKEEGKGIVTEWSHFLRSVVQSTAGEFTCKNRPCRNTLVAHLCLTDYQMSFILTSARTTPLEI